jgi:serine/threonine-protein kinase
MKRKDHPLEAGGRDRLAVEWEGWFERATLLLDGEPLAPPFGREALRRGVSLPLPDGSVLHAQVVTAFLLPGLRLTRDGVPLPGSAMDPAAVMRSTAALIYFLGATNLVIGLLIVKMAEGSSPGPTGVILGATFLALAFFTSKGSPIALLVAATLYALDSLVWFTGVFARSGLGSVAGGLVIRALFLYGFFRGLRAAWQVHHASDAPTATGARVAASDAGRRTRVETASAVPTEPTRRTRVETNVVATGASAPPASPKVPRTATALVGGRVGSWELLESLGEGGMATVFRVRHVVDGGEAAMKLMRSELLSEPDFRERFERECRLVQRLRHPNIVEVLESGEAEGRLYLVMQLLRRGTVADAMRKGNIPPIAVSRLVGHIAAGLQHAHDQGIIHRDVKPGNVLLDERGNARLSDFGIARLAEGGTTLTRTGFHAGSPPYMAPEQWQGGTVDRRADVYALGVMVFEMLAGHAPFQADTVPALMTLHVRGPIPTPRTTRPTLPVAVDGFFRQALAKRPEKRFQSTEALAAALSAIIGGRRDSSGSPSAR